MDLIAMSAGRRLAVVADGGGKKMELQVGIFDAGAGADEAAGFEMVGGAEAALEEQPLSTDQRLGEKAHLAIEGDRLPAGDLHENFEMIVQVLPHPRQMVEGRDADLLQMLCRPDA